MKRWLLLPILMLSYRLEAAAPSIQSTTLVGNLTDQMVLTMYVLNGGTAPQKPLVFADFEQGSTQPTTLGSLTSWTDVGDPTFWGVTTINNRFGSVYAASTTAPGGAPYSATFAFTQYLDGFHKFRHVQDRYSSYNPATPSNQKWCRDWHTPGQQPDLVCGNLSGGLEITNESELIDGGVLGGFSPFGAIWPQAQNYQQEFVFHQNGGTGLNTDGTTRVCDGTGGSPNGACDGIIKYIQNGILSKDRENVFNDILLIRQVDIAETECPGSNTCPSAGATDAVDNIYVSTELAAVVFCDSSTWSACRYRIYQPQSKWLNDLISPVSTITVTAQIKRSANVTNGTLNNNSTLFAYVITDDTGSVSGVNAAGFALTNAGGGSDGTPTGPGTPYLPVRR